MLSHLFERLRLSWQADVARGETYLILFVVFVGALDFPGSVSKKVSR